MEFRLLGAFEVWDNSEPLEIAGAKRRALLALLALRANEVVRSELLVEELWGAHPPRNAAAALHSHVSRLRKTLGADTIASREWGYVLRADPEDVDLRRFENLVAEAEPLAAQQRATKLAEALTLWRGPPLADLVNEPALEHDIARLEELRLSTLERRIDADLEAGQSGSLVGELEALIARHPLREHLRWLLILALYRAGRQAEALEVYRETRRVLTEELGIEPSPELRELERAILQQDPALRASPVSAAVAAATHVRSHRRRRIYGGAFLAALLAGLGVAAAYALSTRAAPVALKHTTSITVDEPNAITTNPHKPSSVKPVHQATTPKTHAVSKHRSGRNTTITTHPSSTHHTTTGAGQADNDKTRRRARQKLVTVKDGFSGPKLNALIWNTNYGGTGSSLTVTNGQLVFSIAGDATFDPQYHWAGSSVRTNCIFPGAFDARIDFTLEQWPQEGSTLAVVAHGGANVEQIQRVSAPWGNGYNGGPDGVGAVVPFRDQSGSLRLTRSHGVIRAEFLHNNRWTEVDRTANSDPIDLEVSVFSGPDSWQQQDVSAAVDNFRVTAPTADCPTG